MLYDGVVLSPQNTTIRLPSFIGWPAMESMLISKCIAHHTMPQALIDLDKTTAAFNYHDGVLIG